MMLRTVRKVVSLIAGFCALASLSGGAGDVFAAVRGWLSTRGDSDDKGRRDDGNSRQK
jgi:hypothetical protein